MKKKLLFVLPALVGMLMVGCTTTNNNNQGLKVILIVPTALKRFAQGIAVGVVFVAEPVPEIREMVILEAKQSLDDVVEIEEADAFWNGYHALDFRAAQFKLELERLVFPHRVDERGMP